MFYLRLKYFVFVLSFLLLFTLSWGVSGNKSVSTTSNSLLSGESNNLKIYALRLIPGQDLKQELIKFTKDKDIQAGFIITCVGSLQKAGLRLADQSTTSTYNGKFEIVSLTGTLSQSGVHLHTSLSDTTGKTIGGHLVEGCLIYTTAEIVIGDAKDLTFTRNQDPLTGYQELFIHKNPYSNK